MEEDTISLKSVTDFFKNKKVQIVLLVLFLIFTLYLGVSIRLEGLENLKDVTTGDYTPLALDPYYFLRVSETILETNGNLPPFDPLRDPTKDVPWTDELLPHTTVWIYQILHAFNPEATLNFADVLNPVIFFVLGLLVFFFLILVLSKKKSVAAFSTLLLAVLPPYLYRTLAGFSDHDSMGMFGFFLALLTFSIGMFYLEKEKLKYPNSIILGLIAGFSAMLSIASWGGIAKFLFMILPLAFLIQWFANGKENTWKQVVFYASFILGIFIFIPIFGFDFSTVVRNNMLNTTGLLSLFTLGYTTLELFLRNSKRIPKKIKEKPVLASFLTIIVLGAIGYHAFIGNIFSTVYNIIQTVLYPFGTGRVTLTVAENAQPYLENLISQVGNTIFYLFLFGCFVVGAMISKGIKDKKYRPLFSASFIFFVVGILFSRFSANSVLNGETFLSRALFFASFLIFAISTVYIYIKSEWKIETRWVIIAAWMIPMLLAVRSAVRLFFAIVPFISFMAILGIYEIGNFARKSKDELLKYGSWALVILLSVLVIVSSVGFYQTDVDQAKYTGPSYNVDWQNAMAWVRENTPEDALFLHWWDYGYWVQTGGDRQTLVDGGYHADYLVHSIARYVLTTPIPETAKSYMKTYGVDYLLIDPTDIGKYSAYSSIGDDDEVSDRASFLPTLVSDPAATEVNENYTTRVYNGGYPLDMDIVYEENGEKIFLPKGRAAIYGIVLQETEQDSKRGYTQPRGIFVYNNKQYIIPIRYLASSSSYFDFETGINSTVYIYPRLGSNQQLDPVGAAMYLSEKTMNSLVAQLYLMNDPNNLYPELELVHEESRYPVPFYYGGYNGPIKIYKVNVDEMTNILERPEFIEEWPNDNISRYGAFDDLEFVK